MTGLYDAGPQSGGRRPAPGRLALVQAFANTFYDLEARRAVDRLERPAGLADWLESRGLKGWEVSRADLDRAMKVREGLRALLHEHNGMSRDADALAGLRGAVAGLPVSITVDSRGVTRPVVAEP